METLELGFETVVRVCILLIEVAGLSIILTGMLKGTIGYFKNREGAGIGVARSLSLGLEVLMGAEILHSVISPSWTELGILAAIVLIRTILSLQLHWKITAEEKKQQAEKQKAEELPGETA